MHDLDEQAAAMLLEQDGASTVDLAEFAALRLLSGEDEELLWRAIYALDRAGPDERQIGLIREIRSHLRRTCHLRTVKPT